MTHQQLTPLENIVGKEEIAHNKQFLLFPQCFLLNQIIVSPFIHMFDIISFFAVELEEPKIGISGKRVKKTKRLQIAISIVFTVKIRMVFAKVENLRKC